MLSHATLSAPPSVSHLRRVRELRARLATFERLQILRERTPLHRLDGLSRELGIDVWAKRDDVGTLALAGTKTRKFEFILGEALARGAKAIVIPGAQHSNSTRAAAAACAQVGLQAHLVMQGEEPVEPSGNLLMARLFGAHMVYAGELSLAELRRCSWEYAARLENAGTRTCLLEFGGSTPVGCLGAVHGYLELVEQMLEVGYSFRELVFASASGGTLAGFQIARAFLGFGPTPIAVLACDDVYADMHSAYLELAGRCASLLGVAELVDSADFRVAGQFVGAGYGIPSPEGLSMMRRARDSDGIMTEPIYTAKALAGFAALTSTGSIRGPSVFWHTGGLQVLMSPDVSHIVLRYLSDQAPSLAPSR